MVRKYAGNVLLAIALTILIVFIGTRHKSISDVAAGPLIGFARQEEPQTGKEADWELTELFSKLLETAPRDFLAGYAVDESFWSWMASRCGREAVDGIASYLSEGGTDPEAWYEITGNSIHVLWTEYCRDFCYETWSYSDVTWKDCRRPDVAVFDFVGDVNFAEDWYTTQAMTERGGRIEDCIAPEIREELQAADVTLVNNEFTYSSRGEPLQGKSYTFRADPGRVAQLSVFGADIVSLGNNHVYDYGKDAFLDTLETLNGAGIPYVGAGKDRNDAQRIRYFIVNGRKVALIAATQIEKFNNFTAEAGEGSPGVLKTIDPAAVNNLIRTAKKVSDYAVVYVHWGAEGVLYAQDDMRQLAASYVQAGADAVIGNHSHRLQGLEYIDGVPVLYSLGNFWFSTGTLYTTVFQMFINADGKLSFALLPCLQQDTAVRMLADGEEKQGFFQYIADLSSNAAIRSDRMLAEQTAEFTAEDGSGLEWYLPGSRYAQHTGEYDLEGVRIDIVGNRVQ